MTENCKLGLSFLWNHYKSHKSDMTMGFILIGNGIL